MRLYDIRSFWCTTRSIRWPPRLRRTLLHQAPVIFSKWTVGDFYFWLMEELNRRNGFVYLWRSHFGWRFVGWCTIVGGHVLSAWSCILSSGRVNVNAIHTSHEPYSIARLIMSNIFDIPYRERILTWCQNKKTDGAFLSIRTPSICQPYSIVTF